MEFKDFLRLVWQSKRTRWSLLMAEITAFGWFSLFLIAYVGAFLHGWVPDGPEAGAAFLFLGFPGAVGFAIHRARKKASRQGNVN
jgi:hypothetical protein